MNKSVEFSSCLSPFFFSWPKRLTGDDCRATKICLLFGTIQHSFPLDSSPLSPGSPGWLKDKGGFWSLEICPQLNSKDLSLKLKAQVKILWMLTLCLQCVWVLCACKLTFRQHFDSKTPKRFVWGKSPWTLPNTLPDRSVLPTILHIHCRTRLSIYFSETQNYSQQQLVIVCKPVVSL